MIHTEGLNEIRDLVATDIDKGQFGTGTTPVTEGDTAIEIATSGTQIATTETKTSQQISAEVIVRSVNGNTNDLSEFALQRTTATAVTYTRDVFTAVTKDSDTDIKATKKLFIDTLQRA